MTFLEKAIEEEKDSSLGLRPQEITTIYCPSSYGFEDGRKCDATDKAKCVECWNREMPGTESKADKEEEWFNRGFEEGKSEGIMEGMNDAWELARKLVVDCKDMTGKEFTDIFGCYLGDVFTNFTPQEALAKMKAYEESQEIKEGDIVDIFGNRAVVTSFGTDNMIIHVVYDDGITNSYRKDRKDIKKTGKHIDIQSILEQIGE